MNHRHSASDEFYIGYQSQAPKATARFVRMRIGLLLAGTALAAGAAAVALSFLGAGTFAFGHPHEETGTMQCIAGNPVLATAAADLPLVGFGKHAAPLELCGANGRTVVITGTRIARDGRELLEVSQFSVGLAAADGATPPVDLGRFDLVGELVDAKCYFGVMNPGEARAHRACAQLCVRGGIPAVFVVRDTSGATAHLIVDREAVTDFDAKILPLVGEPVRVAGRISLHGRWLVIAPDQVDLAR